MKKEQLFRSTIQILFFVIFILHINPRNAEMNVPFLILAFLAGNFFCGWVCPFGTFQEYISKLGQKTLKKRYQVPTKIDYCLSIIKYLPLFFLFFAFIGQIDARRTFLSLTTATSLTSIAIVSLISFSLLAFFIDRPFCRWFCIKGANLGLFSLGRILTIRRNKESCINCTKCDKKCPVQINISANSSVINPQCINCFECISACPVHNTLKIGLRPLNNYSILLFILAALYVAKKFFKLF